MLKRMIISSRMFQKIISSERFQRIVFSTTLFKSYCDKYINAAEVQWFRQLLEREKINVVIDVGAHGGVQVLIFVPYLSRGELFLLNPILNCSLF